MEQSFSFRIRLLILFLCTIPSVSLGQEFSTGPRDLALGGLRALSKEFVNPAYLSFQPGIFIGISANNRFQMSELNTSSLALILPNKFIDFGVKFAYYGYNEYQLLTFKTGFSKKINNSISIGTTIFYRQEFLFIEENARNEIGADFGFFFQVSEQIILGLLANNLLDIHHATSLFCAGIEYRLLKGCSILFEPSFDLSNSFGLHVGLEYELGEKFFIRGGVSTKPTCPSLGAAYTVGKFSVDVGFSSHQTLGYSTATSVCYHF